LQIQLNTSTMRLEEMPLDIGYASEKVTLTTKEGTSRIVGGQNGATQLIVTAPFIDDTFVAELEAIDKALPRGGEHEVTAALIVAGTGHNDPQLEKFEFLIDSDAEFADWYGVRLSGDPLEGELTKALFVISKDGALFYDEFAKNLHDPFNAETALRKIYAAQECYTGKGCH
jgi:peroxiredoxin